MDELHQAKMKLFTNFSHELCTPLTLIINPLDELINSGSFSPQVKRTLSLMKKNTERLLLLVNNLMDIQKYNSRIPELKKQSFNLSQFTYEVYNAFKELAVRKNITYLFRNSLPDHFPVCYDPIELEKVFFNLLSNAFKYTPDEGTVIFQIELCNKEDDIVHVRLIGKSSSFPNKILHFEITDNGLGIPEQDLDKIFDAFYRSRSYEDDSIIGSGVGLNLTRSIIEQHQGMIWAENGEMGGTSIHVLLPFEDTSDTEFKSYTLKSYENEILRFSISEEEEVKEKTHTLLLVEDNKDLLQYLEKIFRNQYHILTASNGKEALFVLEDAQPDLILMDVIMPEMDGIKLCRTVKNNILLSHIPVLLMSAESNPLKMKEGYKAGADDYIVKPFEISLLKTRIENLLITRKNIRKKFEKKISVEELDIEISNEDQEWLKQYTEIIKKNFSNSNLDVDFICQEMGMSRANFYRRVKKLTNLTPAEMIKKLRMEVAAQLLRETDLSISEIIAKVAFNGSGYFAATFKNIYGMTPKDYRKAYSHKP